MISVDPPVCVALDVPDLEVARGVVAELRDDISLFKVGFELFVAEGPKTLEMVHEAGCQVFLDLKLHDIPRTVAAGVRAAAGLGAAFLTVHASGGREMLRAAAETSRECGGPKLLAVTVLTSLAEEDLADLGIDRTARQQALRLGEMAAEEGAHGLVLSPRELDVLRPAVPDLLLCTPGVRPSGAEAHDQRRVLTPAGAISAGADLLVVGRPVLQAADRVAAARSVIEEVRRAEMQRESLRTRDESASLVEAEDAEIVDERS